MAMASAIEKLPSTVTILPWWRISEGAACETAVAIKSEAVRLAAKTGNRRAAGAVGREWWWGMLGCMCGGDREGLAAELHETRPQWLRKLERKIGT
jgi:hypothetical protein